MSCAGEDERGQEDVHDGVVGDQDQGSCNLFLNIIGLFLRGNGCFLTVCISGEPYVVLRDEQLQADAAEPSEETEQKRGFEHST